MKRIVSTTMRLFWINPVDHFIFNRLVRGKEKEKYISVIGISSSSELQEGPRISRKLEERPNSTLFQFEFYEQPLEFNSTMSQEKVRLAKSFCLTPDTSFPFPSFEFAKNGIFLFVKVNPDQIIQISLSRFHVFAK